MQGILLGQVHYHAERCATFLFCPAERSKHPHFLNLSCWAKRSIHEWIPHCVRNDKKVLGTPPPCHAECCKASSLSQFVML